MKYLAILLSLFLTACGIGGYKDYLRMHGINAPTHQNFTHCYNYGCQTRVSLALPEATKNKLYALFTSEPATAEMERQKISQAIKIFEDDIGALTGTQNDKRGTFRLYQDDAKSTQSFQQDCVDESTNTTIYVALLTDLNLLEYHSASHAVSRQPFISGAPWWHQTAVIKEHKTENLYAVDSWFRDNGHAAFIAPLQEWKDGWMPPKTVEN